MLSAQRERAVTVQEPSMSVGAILKRGVKLTPGLIEGVYGLIMVGDALGLPVETWKAEAIAKKYGGIREIHPLEGNPYLKDRPTGIYSDDTQLSLAVTQGIRSPHRIDFEKLVQAHINAYRETTDGWGDTTRIAVERLIKGDSPEISGRVEHPKAGLGNGVLMKISPIALWAVSRPERNKEEIIDIVHRIAIMTHGVPAACATAVGQVFGMIYCLGAGAFDFKREEFFAAVTEGVTTSLARFPEYDEGKLLLERTLALPSIVDKPASEIIEAFGGGTSRVVSSAPFSWAFFAKGGGTIQSVFDVIDAGGDTDSNGSIVGALVGALHGSEAVPQTLLQKVVGKDRVLREVREFAERLIG